MGSPIAIASGSGLDADSPIESIESISIPPMSSWIIVDSLAGGLQGTCGDLRCGHSEATSKLPPWPKSNAVARTVLARNRLCIVNAVNHVQNSFRGVRI